VSSMRASGHRGETLTSWFSWWTKCAISDTAMRSCSTMTGPLMDGFFPSWLKTLTNIFGYGTFSHAVMTFAA